MKDNQAKQEQEALDDELWAKLRPLNAEYVARLQPLRNERWASRQPIYAELRAKQVVLIEKYEARKEGAMKKQGIQCRPGEGVFEAAKRGWGKGAHVEMDGGEVWPHSAPDTIDGRQCVGTVTVRRGESYYVTMYED